VKNSGLEVNFGSQTAWNKGMWEEWYKDLWLPRWKCFECSERRSDFAVNSGWFTWSLYILIIQSWQYKI